MRMLQASLILLVCCFSSIYALPANPDTGSLIDNIGDFDLDLTPQSAPNTSVKLPDGGPDVRYEILWMPEVLKAALESENIQRRQSDKLTLMDRTLATIRASGLTQPLPFLRGEMTKARLCKDSHHCGNRMVSIRSYLAKIYESEVKTHVEVERTVTNPKNARENMAVSMTTSHVKTITSSQGWTIGAKVSGKVKGVNLELSASYQSTVTKADAWTKAFTQTIQCQPGFECRLETWTLSAYYKGFCVAQPFMHCEDPLRPFNEKLYKDGRSMCTANENSFSHPKVHDCDVFWKAREKLCNEKKPRGKKCEVEVPLFQQNGEPINMIVSSFVPTKI